MKLIEIFTILTLHWVFDFVCQTREDAEGKSTSWKYLLSHTFTYSVLWIVPCMIYCYLIPNHDYLMLFPLITFVAHTATDYYTSKVNTQLYKEDNLHGFFVSIGFDQLLHYFQLFGTYIFLKGL